MCKHPRENLCRRRAAKKVQRNRREDQFGSMKRSSSWKIDRIQVTVFPLLKHILTKIHNIAFCSSFTISLYLSPSLPISLKSCPILEISSTLTVCKILTIMLPCPISHIFHSYTMQIDVIHYICPPYSELSWRNKSEKI